MSYPDRFHSYRDPAPFNAGATIIRPSTNVAAGGNATTIAPGVEAFEVIDGDWVPTINLPPITAASKIITIRRGSTNDFNIGTPNTDLDFALNIFPGDIVRFSPSGGGSGVAAAWRWMDADRAPVAAAVLPAANGLTTTAGVDELGGALTKVTTITTSPTNTLVLAGLQNTAAPLFDLVSDVAGVVRTVPYVSAANHFFSSNVGSANTAQPPDGATDLTEAVRREGNTGFGVNPKIQLHTTAFGAKYVETSAPTYTIGATEHTIRLFGNAPQTLTLPPQQDDRIIVITNYGDTAKTLSGTNAITNTLTTVIPPHSSMTIQGGNGTWAEIDRYVQSVDKIHQTASVNASTYVFPNPNLSNGVYTITDTLLVNNTPGFNLSLALPPIAPAGTPLNAPINGAVAIGEIITIKKNNNNVFRIDLVSVTNGVTIDGVAAPATYPGAGDPVFGGNTLKSTLQLKAVSPTAWVVV
jgi:hypothetical protein